MAAQPPKGQPPKPAAQPQQPGKPGAAPQPQQKPTKR